MKTTLEGLNALVTGGTRGIGEAIAKQLFQDGARVIVTGTSENATPPEGCDFIPVNFEDESQLDDFISKLEQLDIDILINNAGINKIGSFEGIEYSDFKKIQQVNVHAPFVLCQSVIPGMRKKKWGRIVNISSIFGKISKELRSPYSASKFALDGMTAALAAEVAPYGILANCVAPGFIDTELTRRVLGEKGINELVGRIPIGRLGKAEEIAVFVAWLAGPENTYLSGQNIAIDGGFTRV